MRKKKIHLIDNAARQKMIAGLDRLADAVKLTLGHGGRNFASGVIGGSIDISNDGVSLAKLIEGRDEFEDIGVRAVREAATKTNEKAGDGTTTAVVLTQAIVHALGFGKDILGKNPVAIAERVKKESEVVVAYLQEMATKITSREHLINIAKVSVENKDLAELIGGAQWDVGAEGTVMAEEHNETTDTVEFTYGVRIDNGLGAGVFMNNLAKQALVLEKTPIIITNCNFNTADKVRELNKLFKQMIDRGDKAVILIGRAFDVTAIALCKSNVDKYFSGEGGFPIYPVNAPYENMDEMMEDLAAATGASYVDIHKGDLKQVRLTDVGVAAKVFVKRYEGIITGPKKGEDEKIDEKVNKRLERIRENIEGSSSEFEKRKLEARIAQLAVGTAMIKVGAETEQERKYKKDKVDDAVNTVKAAMQEGVIPGGGQALMTVADYMPEDSLIKGALRAPYEQIKENAGGGEDYKVEEWVEDPLKVVRTAFEKASSIARSLCTTEIVVNTEWEKAMWVQQAEQNLAETDE
jgi:chaperonin GroEL